MKNSIILFIALVTVGILSYFYNFVSIVLLVVIVISLVILLAAGIARVFRPKLNPKWIKTPLLVAGICAAGIVIGLFRPLEQAVLPTGSVGEQLAHAYKTDQADRMTIKTYLNLFADNMAHRDNVRLEQVQKLYQRNQIIEPIDKFYAAFIFHHSKQTSFFEIAQQLASEAAAVHELKDNYVVQWLAKATYDRWMVSLGKPQKYGTQDKVSFSVE